MFAQIGPLSCFISHHVSSKKIYILKHNISVKATFSTFLLLHPPTKKKELNMSQGPPHHVIFIVIKSMYGFE